MPQPAPHRPDPTRATPTRDTPYRTARRCTALHGTAPRRRLYGVTHALGHSRARIVLLILLRSSRRSPSRAMHTTDGLLSLRRPHCRPPAARAPQVDLCSLREVHDGYAREHSSRRAASPASRSSAPRRFTRAVLHLERAALSCTAPHRAAPRRATSAHSGAPGTGCSVLCRTAPRDCAARPRTESHETSCVALRLYCAAPHRTARLRRASTHRVP